MLIERYIIKAVLSAIGFVTLMLAGLEIFMLFVNQLDDLGRGDYGIMQAAGFVLLQLPYQIYLFFPMASLLGCLLGLGVLANHRELIVMRAAGVSIVQITLAVFKAAIVLILVVTVLGETFIPRLSEFANNYRTEAVSGGQALRTSQGVWLRYKDDFISVERVLAGKVLENVYQFRFDKEHRMRLARKIQEVSFSNGIWEAHNVEQTELNETKISAAHIDKMPWDVWIEPSLLSISMNEPDEMSLYELGRFLRNQKRNHQAALTYHLAYWQRIIQPLTTIVMMLLAIPFIFGPLRSSTMGAKFLAGATMGFGFYIVNRFLGPASQVLQWHPLIAALGPTLLFAILGVYLMRKVR